MAAAPPPVFHSRSRCRGRGCRDTRGRGGSGRGAVRGAEPPAGRGPRLRKWRRGEGKAEGCAPPGGWESGGSVGFLLGLKRVGRSVVFLPVISGSFPKSRGFVARWSPEICTVAGNSEYLQPGLPFLLPCRKLLLLT